MAQWPAPSGYDHRDRRGDRRGHGQWSYGQGGGGAPHNPYEVRMARFLEFVAETDDPADASILVVDHRDERLVSPFQTWLVSEIMANSASSINVLTERDQVMPPAGGFHLSLFGNYTLDGVKAVLAVSVESDTGHTCAQWDGDTAEAISHPAFQPFSWPMLRDTSASYVDLKIFNGNELLFHWVLRGYRSDTDLTVQTQFVDEVLVREVRMGNPRLSVVVAVFIGWRVSILSYESGGRTYSVGPRGRVVAGDSARSRFELRVTARDTEDAYGNDADRLEFRFRDANNRMDLKCSRTSVPGTWLTVSHISGPTLVNTIQSVRQQRARVEGPEQTEQFAQLAAIHQAWWAGSVAQDESQVGNLVVFVGQMEEGNFHVQARAKLMRRDPVIVNANALAEMNHAPEAEVRAPMGPPALTADAWRAGEGRNAALQDQQEQTALANRRAGAEMAHRTLTRVEEAGQHGHEDDPERDRARLDRRFSRSTANLTPAVFAEEISRRSYNRSTCTIEEVEVTTPRAARVGGPTKVPMSQPTSSMACGSGDGGQADQPLMAPASAPVVLGPPAQSSDPEVSTGSEKKVEDV